MQQFKPIWLEDDLGLVKPKYYDLDSMPESTPDEAHVKWQAINQFRSKMQNQSASARTDMFAVQGLNPVLNARNTSAQSYYTEYENYVTAFKLRHPELFRS